MACKNICDYEGLKLKCNGRAKPYHNGMKYCERCRGFFCSDAPTCFCCGTRLRIYGRNQRGKRKVHRY